MKFLPKFKSTLLIVGISFMLLSASLFSKGLIKSMSEFEVPSEILNSPHYFDAIFWVYVHMFVLGILVLLIGLSVKDYKSQKWISLILFIVNAFYTILDFKSSDSFVGNSLYKGEKSLAPAFIGSFVTLLFLQLTIQLFSSKSKSIDNA